MAHTAKLASVLKTLLDKGLDTGSGCCGIIIFRNNNDPEPPHFHARYGDKEVL